MKSIACESLHNVGTRSKQGNCAERSRRTVSAIEDLTRQSQAGRGRAFARAGQGTRPSAKPRPRENLRAPRRRELPRPSAIERPSIEATFFNRVRPPFVRQLSTPSADFARFRARAMSRDRLCELIGLEQFLPLGLRRELRCRPRPRFYLRSQSRGLADAHSPVMRTARLGVAAFQKRQRPRRAPTGAVPPCPPLQFEIEYSGGVREPRACGSISAAGSA